MYLSNSTSQNLPDCYDKIEELCCDCTIDELHSIGNAIQEKAHHMESELSKTVTVDDFKKRMKDTQEIPLEGGIAHDDIGDVSADSGGDQ